MTTDPPFLVYKICQKIVLHLPLKVSYKIADILSDFYRLFRPRDYKIVQENLRIIFPEKSAKEIIGYTRQTFRSFGRYLVDFLYFPKIDKEYIKRNIQVEGIENFDFAFSQKKGVIGITAHLGSWETGGIIVSVLGYPVSAIALEHSNKQVQRFFVSQREKKGLRVIFPKDASREVLKVLRRNEMVVFLNDKDYFGTGVEAEIFGRKVVLPRGPAVFALKMKTPIVPGFTIREGNKLKVIIEKPLSFSLTGEEKEDIRRITQQISKVIERYVRSYPGQWFYFERL
ncbi:MAG: hypothetical protein DRP75_00040 [Candidatus Omnitrophota bacterium]|nr:MAG: hypothetical protein DRP75_00040 [Candidatus Omnitrophota bacterium]